MEKDSVIDYQLGDEEWSYILKRSSHGKVIRVLCEGCNQHVWASKDRIRKDGITRKGVCEECQENGVKPQKKFPPPHTKEKDGNGYIKIFIPLDDPLFELIFDDYDKKNAKDIDGYGRWISEHRYVMTKRLGRKLKKGEGVHHKNGRKDDNRTNNLELWLSPQRYGVRSVDLIKDYLNDMSIEKCKLFFSEYLNERKRTNS